ncbi:MAG TPA: alpha/beta fold hydrolase [Candidatus Limnocylindrales bacterium]|nr:alpha/beta fold hydrolase [Candidatus Limnocylindrales bacterium]
MLVCLSFCGGGTTSFRPWAGALAEDVDLALVCYPGRERRIAEPAMSTWTGLMDDVLALVRSLAHRPYVLFGHSMGAWVAFEVAAAAERDGWPAPRALIVSASSPPSRAAQERLAPPTLGASDEQVLDWMRRVGQLSELIIADPGLRALTLELFRADRRASDSYEFTPGRMVRAPLQVLSGVDDPQVTDEGGWRALAAGDYRFDKLPGGHFYTPEIWAQLPRHIAALTA